MYKQKAVIAQLKGLENAIVDCSYACESHDL